MARKYIKKLFLVILLIFCVYPTITLAEGEGSQNAITPSSAVGLLNTIFLLNPTTWPIGIALRSTSQDIGAGESDRCGNITSNIDPYCAILNVIFDVERMAAPQIVATGQGILSYTVDSKMLSQASDQENIIIQSGWQIVRNIANAALVIGLIVIAITIILGYQENKAKQLLINFILIALLINFTPVICSFIIDGANIITSSFLAGGTNTGYAGAIKNAFMLLHSDTSETLLSKVVIGLIVVVFSIIAAVVMLLYALLFIARTAILWILVIVSPVAFATKVFPQSKYIKKIFPSVTYWDDWWESFVQWAVISIPASIFLYISIQLMSVVGASLSGMTSTTIPDFLMAYATPFIFLIAGFMITVSSGGQVGSFVGGLATGAFAATGGRAIGWGKEKVAGVGGWAEDRVKRTGSYVKEGALGIAGGALSGDIPISGTPGSVMAGAKELLTSKTAREIGRQRVADWKTRMGTRLTGAGLISPPDIEKNKDLQKDFDNYNNNWKAYKFDERQKIEKQLIEKDTSRFLKGGVNNADEYKRRLASVITNGEEKQKIAAYMHASGNQGLVGGSVGLNNFVSQSKIDDIGKSIRKISAKEDRERITAEAIENNPVILENLGSKQAISIIKEGSEEQKRALKEKTIGRNNADFARYIVDQGTIIHNPASTPDQIREAQIKAERALKLAGEIYRNS